jgi:hypothetical protein
MDVENYAVFVCDRFCSQANNPLHAAYCDPQHITAFLSNLNVASKMH